MQWLKNWIIKQSFNLMLAKMRRDIESGRISIDQRGLAIFKTLSKIGVDIFDIGYGIEAVLLFGDEHKLHIVKINGLCIDLLLTPLSKNKWEAEPVAIRMLKEGVSEEFDDVLSQYLDEGHMEYAFSFNLPEDLTLPDFDDDDIERRAKVFKFKKESLELFYEGSLR